MSENEEQAMNWTMGLVGSIALHVIVVGLFVTLGRSTPPTADEATGETPSAEMAETDAEAQETEARESTPPRVEPVRPTRVEMGSSNAARVQPVSPNAEANEPKVYVVRRGDNASRIAQKHGLTLQELATLNGTTVRKLNEIAIGQKLKVAE